MLLWAWLWVYPRATWVTPEQCVRYGLKVLQHSAWNSTPWSSTKSSTAVRNPTSGKPCGM